VSGACHRRKGNRVERTVVRALQDHGLAACATSSPRRDSPVTCRARGKRVSRRGRSQIYCSRRCRQRAYWDRRVLAAFSAIVSHDSKIKALPRAKSPPSDSFSTPVNLLGGGQWRWPHSARLDAKTAANILCAEIGSTVVVPNPQQGRKELIVIDPQNANPFRPPSVRLEQSFNAGGRICKQLTERTM
jgi:hypothetical protein